MADRDFRYEWDLEMKKLNKALSKNNYAYGGYEGAFNTIYPRFAQPGSDISYQEAQGVIGGIYDKYYKPKANIGMPTRTYGGSGGGEDVQGRIRAMQGEYNKQWGNLEPQFRALMQKQRGKLQGDYDTNLADLTKNYAGQRESLEKGYLESQKMGGTRYAARGLGDSSFNEKLQSGLTSEKDKTMTEMGGTETRQKGEMLSALQAEQEKLSNLEHNFYNDTYKFGTLDEALNWKSKLDEQKSSINSAIENAKYSGSSSQEFAGSSLLKMLEGVNSIVSNTQGYNIDSAPMIKQWVNQFYSDPVQAEEAYQGIVSGMQNQ